MKIIVELNDGKKLSADIEGFDAKTFADSINSVDRHDQAIVHGNNVFVKHQFKVAYESDSQPDELLE